VILQPVTGTGFLWEGLQPRSSFTVEPVGAEAPPTSGAADDRRSKKVLLDADQSG